MVNFTLKPSETGLIVIDVQDKLFSLVERSCEILLMMQKVIKGFQIIDLPIIVTEQNPQKIGKTIASLISILPDEQKYYSKTSFSCLGDETLRDLIINSAINQWVLVGIEAHVCVLQSAKDLLRAGKQVTILNDAISSRSIYDFSTAIAEMRDCGVRVSSVETVLFELMADYHSRYFHDILALIK